MEIINIMETLFVGVLIIILSIAVFLINFDMIKSDPLKGICKRITLIVYLIFATSALAFVATILISLGIPEPTNDKIASYYREKQDDDIRKITERVLDSNDSVPNIYCLENQSSIISVLNDDELISKMISALDISEMPCIASYHFKRRKDPNNSPHFILLNKRFYTTNTIGTLIKWFSDKIGKSYYTDFLLERYGKENHSKKGDYYFIFNARQIGGSKKNDNPVTRHTSLCKWADRETKLMKFSIEIECIEAVYYNDKVILDDATLMFRGKLAYCMQGFLNDIGGDEICKK